MRFTNVLTFFLISSLLVIGCANTNNILITTPDPTKATTPATSTPVPSIPTTTPTFTPTTYPTVSPVERQKEIEALLQTNSNCSKPCFWGIKPGINNFDEAVAFIESMGNIGIEDKKNSIRHYNVSFIYKDQIHINLAITGMDRSVNEINVDLQGIQNTDISNSDWLAFRPDSILKTYGIPSRVEFYLSIGPSSDGGVTNPSPYRYGFIFYYQQIVIDYYGGSINPSSNTNVCPLVDHQIENVKIWLGRVFIDDPQKLKGKDLGELTTLQMDKFYALMTGDPKKACINLNFSKLLP